MEAPASPRRGRPPGSEGPALLAVARQEFVSHGYRGTTMDAIAARARISKQTLYGAYGSKEELYAAVVRDWVDQGYDALRPHSCALASTADPDDGLHRLAAALQAGILSPPVLQMRTLVAAEANAFPSVAADYLDRSWVRNLRLLAEALATLTQRGLLAVDDPEVAAEQFVWLVIGAPLNELSLRGPTLGRSARRLKRTTDQAVATFLSRYRPSAVPRAR